MGIVLKKSLRMLAIIIAIGLIAFDIIGILHAVDLIVNNGYSVEEAIDKSGYDMLDAIGAANGTKEEELPMVNANITWDLLWKAP